MKSTNTSSDTNPTSSLKKKSRAWRASSILCLSTYSAFTVFKEIALTVKDLPSEKTSEFYKGGDNIHSTKIPPENWKRVFPNVYETSMMLELKPKGLKPPKKERKKSRETNIPPAHGHKHATTIVADRVQPPAEEDGTSWPGGARPRTRVTLLIMRPWKWVSKSWLCGRGSRHKMSTHFMDVEL